MATATGCSHCRTRRQPLVANTTRHYGAAAPRPEARLSQEHHAAAAAGQAHVAGCGAPPSTSLPTTARCSHGRPASASINRSRDHWVEISPDLSTIPRTRSSRSPKAASQAASLVHDLVDLGIAGHRRGDLGRHSDGKVHVTRHREDMERHHGKACGARGREDAAVSRVRASHHVPGRAYIAKSGYKFDDFQPFLFRTDDFGATWTSIGAGRSSRSTSSSRITEPQPRVRGERRGCLRVDERGGRWVKMNNNMPNVPVHDLLVHPRITIWSSVAMAAGCSSPTSMRCSSWTPC